MRSLGLWALPRKARRIVVGGWVAFLIVWFPGVLSFSGLGLGNPASARPGCRYPLEDHGSVLCVGHHTWLAAKLAEERIGLGVCALFLTMHVVVAFAVRIREPGPVVAQVPDAR